VYNTILVVCYLCCGRYDKYEQGEMSMTPNITVLWCEGTQQYGIGFSFYAKDDSGNSSTLHSTAWVTPEQLTELKQAIAQCESERTVKEETE
jgi:hypothetical protein